MLTIRLIALDSYWHFTFYQPLVRSSPAPVGLRRTLNALHDAAFEEASSLRQIISLYHRTILLSRLAWGRKTGKVLDSFSLRKKVNFYPKLLS